MKGLMRLNELIKLNRLIRRKGLNRMDGLVKTGDTHQCLFYQHTEEESIANFSEGLEDLCSQVWVLNQVTQLGLVVSHHPCSVKREC